MVMDNKGPQETKMETFPWWLNFTNPSETYESSQMSIYRCENVSFLWTVTNVVVTSWHTILSLSAMLSDQIRMTPTHPKHHMFHRVHSKSILYPQNVDESNSTSILEH